MKKFVTICIVVLGIALCMAAVSYAAPMGTAFTYQGWLMDKNNNKPADGDHDFEFSLYDANDLGNKIGSTITKDNVDVKKGFFGVSLDFVESEPNAFKGDARWLEIAVRPGASTDPCDFDILSPRTELTPTPYSLHTRGIIVDDSGNVDVDGSMVVREWIEVGTGTVQINRPQNIITFTAQQGPLSGTIRTDPGSNMPLILNAGATGDIQLNPTSTGNVGIRTDNPSTELQVNGVVTANAFVGDGIVPVGGIIMWSGLIADIPDGWALCDGTNGTPDLTSQFIRSVPNSSTDPGSTGGSATHTHSAGSYSAGGHSHTYSGTTGLPSAEYCCICSCGTDRVASRIHTHDYSGTTSSVGGGTVSGTSGGGSSLPPFYELAFIMRTGS